MCGVGDTHSPWALVSPSVKPALHGFISKYVLALLFTLLSSINKTIPLCLFCYGVIENSPEVGLNLFQSLYPSSQKDPSLREKSCSFKV